MDVRCERCRTQYVFGEDQVGPDGLTVRCSNCGHVFLVKKKALVVTVPVKPGELREAPVPTADLNRGAQAQAAAPRPGGDKVRPWSLRNRRGDLYPFKDLSTLQKWIVERKASRDDEVSHLGGPWRRLGDMLELESFFALVDRAERGATPASLRAGRASATPAAADERGAQPTLLDFPPPRAAFGGAGSQPVTAQADRFAVPVAGRGPDAPEASAAQSTMSLGSPPPEAQDVGPVLAGAVAPVEASEPAWTSNASEQPVEQPAKAGGPPGRASKRASFAPVLVVLAVVVIAAGVYFVNPAWLGLPAPGAPAKPEAERAAPQVAQPAPPAPEPAPAAPAEKGGAPGDAPIPGTPPSAKPQGAPAAGVPGAPNETTATANAPPSAASAGQAPQPREPAVDRDERGQRSTAADRPSPSSDAKLAPTAEQKPPAVAGAPEPRPPAEAAPAAEAAKLEPPEPAPPKVAESAPKRTAAVQRAAPEKPSSLKRILSDARKLRIRGKPEEALKAYGRAIEVEPANADALAGRGVCYLELSQYGPAEASFQAALEADARHAEALMGLAETYRYEGRRTEAVTYYQRYVAAHPDGEDAAAARSAIDALKE